MATLRSRLSSQVCIGIFSKTTDSSFVEAAGYAGLDFIILDTEHGPASWETIHNHVRAASLTNMASIIRVSSVDAHAIGSALDSGADGIQVPNIINAEQAKEAVSAARFHPLGSRGVCRFVRAARFGSQDKFKYLTQSNESLLVLQVEGVEGVRNIKSILSVPGFDVLFVGPYDLSQSIGKPGEVDSPDVLKLIDEISTAVVSSGKALGIFCDSPSSLSRYRTLKVNYLSYSVDVSLFGEALSNLKSSRQC
ncbi:HpcH/HpaI aldolase/citrate lyase family protein [Synechococcus sp. CB0205]|uniref:HpcH/HpaI aldolase family protein n=1 Tax=Synechococcus sp. CB0205 TaxID=232363 RepID=UPI0002002D67|nr:aldolase/citrate lyase family protein [Synechococcus sp. CB0205]